MPSVLIVCPYFPPSSAADMHRVRTSLPYYRQFGWLPIVLAVDPKRSGVLQEPELKSSIPSDIPVYYSSAIPESYTRPFGFGDLGLRSLNSLWQTGSQIIRQEKVDLVFFSTTVFTTMILGRLWKKKYGIPFVLDIQDMWSTNYYDTKPRSDRPPKYRLSRFVHKRLESWTMNQADGLMAVSEAYLSRLCDRYPRLRELPRGTLPFGVSPRDFELADLEKTDNSFFQAGDGNLHGVYIGRGGRDMAPALRLLFEALASSIRKQPEPFSRIQLHFIGTSYAGDSRAQKTIEPVAKEFHLENRVHEYPLRIPYFSALRLLLASDFLVVPGSDDPEYSPSKVYPYIPARKPMLCILHEKSNVVSRLRKMKAADVVTFAAGDVNEKNLRDAQQAWKNVIGLIPNPPQTDWSELSPYTSESLTREQCLLFDSVFRRRYSLREPEISRAIC